MAIYPCDWVPHRYPQAQQSVYITYVMEGLQQTNQLRLCPQHFGQERAHVQEALAMVDENSQFGSMCAQCDHDASCVVSVKVFGAKTEAEQYAADFCGPCAQRVLQDLKMSHGRALRDRLDNGKLP